MIKIGSDFSGVGAFNQALQRLGINYEEVFACDMDKYARQTFIENYGEPKYYPKNVYDREIPKESLDIYMTSPPCQAFSLAGKRKGEDDKRGILFYNSHEFIVKNKPRYFIFENVKGLLSDAKGRTFQIWLDMLGGKSVNGNPVIFPREEAVPYHVYCKVINAKDHGVPQNRERVFIIGIRDDKDNVFNFPKEEHLTKRLKDILESDVDEEYFLSDDGIKNLLLNQKFNKFNPLNEFSDSTNTITARCNKISNDNTFIKVKSATTKGYEYPKVAMQLKGGKWDKTHEQSGRVYDVNGIGATVHTMGGGNQEPKIYDDYKIRKLTPRECFRLMDFPDTFKWSVSDTQAYKQAGNSIAVNVLCKLISKLNL